MTDEMFQDYLNDLNTQCGYNADFFGQAWAITYNVYVTDMEDGTYTIVETDLYSEESEDNILLVGNCQECMLWLVNNTDLV